MVRWRRSLELSVPLDEQAEERAQFWYGSQIGRKDAPFGATFARATGAGFHHSLFARQAARSLTMSNVTLHSFPCDMWRISETNR